MNNSNLREKKRKTTKTRKNREKQLYGYFKRQTDDIAHEKTWTWPRHGNPYRET